MRSQLSKMATPAHLAQTATADLNPEAQWHPAPHLMHINERLVAACTSATQDFLDLEVSVRHGKSLLVSGFLPVWYLGFFPDRRVLLLSYNEDKAAEWGAFTREVMSEWGPQLFGITVDAKNASRTLWKVKGHRGEVLSAGLGGTITGKGGDLVVIDDPIKNREEADSPTMRQKLVAAYYSNVRTRLSPYATVVLAMARWHEADVAGQVVHTNNERGDQWDIVRFPALAEAPKDENPETWRDELGRREGDALWPAKYPRPILEQIKATVMNDDPQTWHSLYQQNPTAREGKDFKIDKWVITPYVDRNSLRMVRFWDLAATDSKQSDWTVGVLMGMDGDNMIYVLDVQRFRADPGDLEQRVLAVARADGTHIPIRLEQERAGSGKIVTHQFVRLLTGFDVDASRPEGDKVVRARPFAAQQNKQRVLLERADWNHDYIEEHRVFPNARHDDQVDASSGAFAFLADVGPSFIETEVQQNLPLEEMYQRARNDEMTGGDAISAARRLARSF